MKHPVSLRRSVQDALSEKASAKKIPVTKEYMALKVASGELLTDAEMVFPDALVESVRPMAFYLSNRYGSTCRDSVEDLAADCMARSRGVD